MDTQPPTTFYMEFNQKPNQKFMIIKLSNFFQNTSKKFTVYSNTWLVIRFVLKKVYSKRKIRCVCVYCVGQDTLLKDRQRQLVSIQPNRLLFICCVYFTLILKLLLCVAGQQSALSLVGSKLLICSFPCLDFVGHIPTYWFICNRH